MPARCLTIPLKPGLDLTLPLVQVGQQTPRQRQTLPQVALAASIIGTGDAGEQTGIPKHARHALEGVQVLVQNLPRHGGRRQS